MVAAWGNHGVAGDRAARVIAEALSGIPLHCLETTKTGAPRHPLYVHHLTDPILYESEA